MPHLLNVWPSVSERLRAARQVLLMLDYDGTLTPIVERPELALIPSETKESLSKLARKRKYVVAVISARSLEDVTARVGIDGLIYGGNHGMEMRGPGLDFVHPEAEQLRGTIDQAYQKLGQGMAGFSGVFTEHKGLSLTVHYRQAPSSLIGNVKEKVESIIARLEQCGALTISPGKMALEIRPNVAWHKGSAVSRLLSEFLQAEFPQAESPHTGIALFFGDDLPDEEGFAAVQGPGGIGVFVGPARQPTGASHRLDSPEEVGQALRLMDQL